MAETAACSACGAGVPAGAKFCMECGTPQALACPSCSAPVGAGQKFCMECGAPLAGGVTAAPAPGAAALTAGRPERRLVTVLFADLVSFTTLSEHRDPEVVRDMLEHYFERCRTIIARYGGTVEKFIGDAVMAVWGTPVAREDDAERAVRAGLELVGAVSALGAEIGMPELRVRAGLLTGETAVNVGAEHEGMVIGDAVNTASRIQALAQPESVYVEDATRRATEAAIAYEDAGTYEVKGRAQPVRVFKALRVLGGVGGSRRGSGLEAPYVGRDAELRAVTLAGERVIGERRAEKVTVIGEAGMGKSRLAWEFEKKVDGIADEVFWHRGRCLSYGEGVSFWALAEIVRMRADVAENDPADQARAKLHATVERYVTDERERRLVLPRLEHLLGLGEGTGDPSDLFSGWRLFFERLAEVSAVVLVFEDLHWADTGLLDFIDHLVEWSSESAILVVALARPEVLERRPGWEAGAHRLRPLDPAAMRAMLGGLIPGLPDATISRLAERAEGIPLYAVETVRMMLDRGVLAQEGEVYAVTGDVDEVPLPETLHALVASRLDGLPANERRLLQDASVLGQTFYADGLAALAQLPVAEVGELLDGLVAKQLLEVEHDPRSPERGQYGFVQAVLKAVAYGTLGRRDRKQRHLAAATHLEQAWGDSAEDYAEVLATHYTEAVAAEPEAADVPALRDKACDTLSEAGRRAISFGLGGEASKWYERAAEMAAEPLRQAELLDHAGRAAYLAKIDSADELWERSRALYQAHGQPRAAAVVRARMAEQLLDAGSSAEGRRVLEEILEEVGVEDVDADFAFVAGMLARMYLNSESPARGLEMTELVLRFAERDGDPELLSDTLVTRGTLLLYDDRAQEGAALMRHALAMATEADLPAVAIRVCNNLQLHLWASGSFEEALELCDRGAELAERAGDRLMVGWLDDHRAVVSYQLGRWDDALEVPEGRSGYDRDYALVSAGPVYALRGDERLGQALEAARSFAESDDQEEQVLAARLLATAAQLAGDHDVALEHALVGASTSNNLLSLWVTAPALESAVAAGRPEAVEPLLDLWRASGAAVSSPQHQGQLARFRGQVARDAGDRATAEAELARAVALQREARVPFELAKALRDLGELRGDPVLSEEANALFRELGAVAYLDAAALPA